MIWTSIDANHVKLVLAVLMACSEIEIFKGK